MRDEILAFLRRAQETGDVSIDLCDTGPNAGIVRAFEPQALVDLEMATDAILDAAKSDIGNRSGKVRFEIVGVREGRRWGRQALVIDAGGSNAFGVEDANMPGIIVELIRDKREIMRMAVAHTDNIMARMQTMNDQYARQLIAIEAQRIEAFGLLEDLTQAKQSRELAMKRAEVEAKQSARMLEEFIPMLSAAGNKLVGHVTGEAMPLGPEMITGFLGSFDEDQIAKLASAMSPTQAAAFFMIMEGAAKAKEDAEKKLNAKIAGGSNGAPALGAG